MGRRQRGTALAVTVSLLALLLAAPRPAPALRLLADAGSSTDPTGPLVAAVSLGAWALAGWLVLTVTVVLLARLPGLLGRAARAVAGRVAPVTVRRAVEAALGITVAIGVVAPTAAVAAPLPAPTSAATADTAWDLDWPSRTAPASAVDRPTAAPATTAAGPPASSPRVTGAPVTPSGRPPSARPVRPAPATPPTAVRPSPVAPPGQQLVVRPGDTLWSLAEASLRSAGTRPTDRRVAQEWPRWWAANRDAVGDDPDLLLPGTVLRPPAGSPGPP